MLTLWEQVASIQDASLYAHDSSMCLPIKPVILCKKYLQFPLNPICEDSNNGTRDKGCMLDGATTMALSTAINRRELNQCLCK